MKVKKFRIRPRIPVTARILKSILSVRQLPTEIEEILPKEADQFVSRLIPAAFYQTWSREELPAGFQALLQSADINRAVAVSALVATIGPEPEEWLSDMLMNGETQRAQITTALCEESSELAFQFILKLLANDAKSDDCEVSEPISISELSLLQEALSLVDAAQEGITLDNALHLSPRFTKVGLVAWFPVAKKKKAAALPKKRTA